MKKLEPPVIPVAYTPPRAAAALDVSPQFFEDHIAPELRIVRRSRKRLIAVSELQRWVDEHAEAPMVEQVGGRR